MAQRLQVVKGQGTLHMGKISGSMGAEAWRKAWENRKPKLVEEPESEVEDSGDETEAKAGWQMSAKQRRLRNRYTRQAKLERKRWRLKTGERDLLGHTEGSQSSYYLLQTKNGRIEATEISNWIAFKPELAYETLPYEVAENALKDGRTVDLQAARAAMPWRNNGDDTLEKFKDAKKPLPKTERRGLAAK